MKNMLLLHPGEMGTSIGASLVKGGSDVYWIAEGRSEATVTRAYGNGFKGVELLDDALSHTDVVFSICPPEHALSLATEVRDRGYRGIYVDGNAVSPETSLRISELFNTEYVDGGIIGPPAWQEDTTRLYLSGQHAEDIVKLFDGTLTQAKAISEEPGKASALKMAYAAYTKGGGALLLSVAALAEHYGVSESLRSEWDLSQPTLNLQAEGSANATSGKAWRFVGEMQEIEKTFIAADLPGGFHHGAAEIYRRLERFKNDPQALNTVIAELLDRSTK